MYHIPCYIHKINYDITATIPLTHVVLQTVPMTYQKKHPKSIPQAYECFPQCSFWYLVVRAPADPRKKD